jgi:hypothetical protein
VVARRKLLGQILFEAFVFSSRAGMVAEIVAKRQGPSLFSPAPVDDVHVVTVRPLERPMEERTKRVIGMIDLSPVRRRLGGNPPVNGPGFFVSLLRVGALAWSNPARSHAPELIDAGKSPESALS